MQKTYHGGCHCGAVKFSVGLDLAAGTSRCNCSYCRKLRTWSARSVPDRFHIDKGADNLGAYVFENGTGAEHRFCKICGLTLFVTGDIPELGGAYVSVMVSVLEDVTEAELIASPITWCDGLHDNWWNAPAEVRHL